MNKGFFLFRWFCHFVACCLISLPVSAQVLPDDSDQFDEPLANLNVLSGSWVDLTRGGEGWIIEVIDDDRAVVFWFTFDENGDRTWLIGVANREGNTLSAEMLLADGPVFGAGFDQDLIGYESWGSLDITFTSCGTASLNYASVFPAFGSGSLSPERLVHIDGLNCEQPSMEPASRFSGWTGSWIDEEFGGEGWIIEVIDENTVLIFWFTFDPNGDRVWLFGTAERQGNSFVADLLLADGPIFGAGFDQDNVAYTDWGTLEFSFRNCSEASAQYASLLPGYGSGVRQVDRLSSLAGLDCTEPPNILLVIADDFGLDALSSYGIAESTADTPVLADLAENGLVFEQFWANPTCSPTRAALITGKHGVRTGVFQPGDLLPDSELSIQDQLEQALPGVYANAVIGKWHLAANNDFDHPERMGVQYFAGILGGGVNDYSDWALVENGNQSNSTEYTTSKFVDLSLDWIEQQQQPWFLWLAMNAPHEPFHLPPAHLHSRNLSGTEADIDSNPLDYYQAMIEAMDTEIGRLLEGLDQQTRENTTIIFMGDNGTPRRVIQAPYTTAQGKGSLYQGGVNVPMFVSGAGVGRSGEREESLVGVTDLFATISEIVGVESGMPVDSISFAGLFDLEGVGTRSFLYADGNNDEVSSWTIRNDQHKLIADEQGRMELYDLPPDPFENNDLVQVGNAPADVIQELQVQADNRRTTGDITNAIFINNDANCGSYANNYEATAQDEQNERFFEATLAVTADDTSCTFASNGIPNHDFNDMTANFATDAAEINRSFSITRSPTLAGSNTALAQRTWDAIMLNGVVLDLLSAGCYDPGAQQADAAGNIAIGCFQNDPYLLDPLGPIYTFGADAHNAHTQPDGTYHYHGDPNAMFDDMPGPFGSPVIGFAADGLPIYGSYFLDSNNVVREAISGYILKTGSRAGTGSPDPSGPGGSYNGTYTSDYEFTDAGDLDECNGMAVDGQYGYYVTDSYPWVLNCHRGTVDTSFMK